MVTEHGAVLYERAKEILGNVQDTLLTLKGSEPTSKGTVRIGVPPIIGTCVFPMLLEKFSDDYPLIRLQIDQHGAKHVQQLVEMQELDVALTINPLISRGLEAFPIATDSNVVVVSKDHPLAACSSVTYKELRDERFVLLGEGHMLYSNILVGCREAGFEPNTVFKGAHWDFILQLVRLNMGISILPYPIIREYAPAGVSTLALNHSSGKWEVVLIRRRNTEASPAVNTFINYIVNAAE